MTIANTKLTAEQITNILDKLVPVIAAKEDHEFFRGVIGIQLAELNSANAAAFVTKLLNQYGA